MGKKVALAVFLGIAASIIIFFLQKNNIIKTQSEIVLKSSVEEKKLAKNYLGIKYVFIDKKTSEFNNIPVGGRVEEVIEKSPADLSGLKKGDIITQINGERIDSESKISEIITESQTGSVLTIVLQRAGEEKVLYVQN